MTSPLDVPRARMSSGSNVATTPARALIASCAAFGAGTLTAGFP